jgi:hypothetical protein
MAIMGTSAVATTRGAKRIPHIERNPAPILYIAIRFASVPFIRTANFGCGGVTDVGQVPICFEVWISGHRGLQFLLIEWEGK